jgi:UDP-N-acetylmuramoyl-tripeptide--D-alanyl-D-alanine ligase
LVGLRAAEVADELVTLGPRAHVIAEAARKGGMKESHIHEFDSLAEVTSWLEANLASTDTALLKGSHGLRMDRIVSELERAG